MKLPVRKVISFSYDNKYVAIVGKPLSDGYLNLTNLVFDETNSILKVGDRICDTFLANGQPGLAHSPEKGCLEPMIANLHFT